jgi:4-hydroxyphenylacetate 3-monooxygenase
MFYAGARFVAAGHSYRTFDWGAARGMVDHLLSTSSTRPAAPWSERER